MSPDGVARPDEPPHDPRMDARVSRREDLATKADLMDVRTEFKTEIWSVRSELKDEIADVKAALADNPSRIYMWGIMTAMVPGFACGLAGLAILI